MRIHEHPDGRIVTLAVPERFVVRGADGTRIKTDTVTTFETERYWTAAGRELGTNRFAELPDRFADFGLLPPHVRRVTGGPQLDFGQRIADTEIGRAQAVQHGQLPTDTKLRESEQGVRRTGRAGHGRVTVLRVAR